MVAPLKKQAYTPWMFLISIIITISIFLAGILLGWTIDKVWETDILKDMRYNELDTESYTIEQNFLNVFGIEPCSVLESRLGNIKYRINQIGSKLQADSEDNIKADLDYVKRKYFLAEMKLLILLQDLNKRCQKRYIPIVFFYTKDDAQSNNQGVILTWLNEKYGEKVIVLSFDKDYVDEPLINTFKQHYNITETSTVIIDDQKFDYFLTRQELTSLVAEKI